MSIKTVIKSNGQEVPFDASKLNRMAEWADNLGVGWSSLVLNAIKKVSDKCSTLDIQNALIDSCAEKADKAHLAMAARLFLGTMYKNAHGGFEERPHLYDFYNNMLILGLWKEMSYDATELEYLNEHLDHDKDLNYEYSVLKQLDSKYCKKLNDISMETPQYLFMGVAMDIMENQPEDTRLDDVVKYYTYLSDLKINLPTPFLSGLRSKTKGLASCAVLKGDDTADSLEAAIHNAYKQTVSNAGIGISLNCRSIKDPVRNGAIKHTGKLPYYRYIQGSVGATKQEVRGGSATVQFTALDPEIEDLLRLKHVTTVSEKQIRGLDYSFGACRLLAEKSSKGEDWYLMSQLHAPE
ncbi:ribonucleotide reductase N-terminal alpha domain-containing protein, partial [Vibrio cholerae]